MTFRLDGHLPLGRSREGLVGGRNGIGGENWEVSVLTANVDVALEASATEGSRDGAKAGGT